MLHICCMDRFRLNFLFTTVIKSTGFSVSWMVLRAHRLMRWANTVENVTCMLKSIYSTTQSILQYCNNVIVNNILWSYFTVGTLVIPVPNTHTAVLSQRQVKTFLSCNISPHHYFLHAEFLILQIHSEKKKKDYSHSEEDCCWRKYLHLIKWAKVQ